MNNIDLEKLLDFVGIEKNKWTSTYKIETVNISSDGNIYNTCLDTRLFFDIPNSILKLKRYDYKPANTILSNCKIGKNYILVPYGDIIPTCSGSDKLSYRRIQKDDILYLVDKKTLKEVVHFTVGDPINHTEFRKDYLKYSFESGNYDFNNYIVCYSDPKDYASRLNVLDNESFTIIQTPRTNYEVDQYFDFDLIVGLSTYRN